MKDIYMIVLSSAIVGSLIHELENLSVRTYH